MSGVIRFPIDPEHGRQLEAHMDDLQREAFNIAPPEWSRGSVNPYSDGPLEVSDADYLVSERLVRGEQVIRRALEERVEQLLDVASTTRGTRRMDPYPSFFQRREIRRRTALAEELWELRAALKVARR